MSYLEQYRVDGFAPMNNWIDLTVSTLSGTNPHTAVTHVFLLNFLPPNEPPRGYESPCGTNATFYLNSNDYKRAEKIRTAQSISYFSDPVPNTVIELLSNLYI